MSRPYCRITNLEDKGLAQRQAASRYLRDLAALSVLRDLAALSVLREMPLGKENSSFTPS